MKAKLMIDDEEVLELDTLDNLDVEVNIDHVNVIGGVGNNVVGAFPTSKEYIFKLKDVEFHEDYTREEIESMSLRMVHTRYIVPKGLKLPKKKRIRKKVLKNYKQELRIEQCRAKFV